MISTRTAAALFAIGVILITPAAWSCDVGNGQECSMSACPMSQQQRDRGCHDSGPTVAGQGVEYEATTGGSVLCCEAATEQEPTEVYPESWKPEEVSLSLVAGKVEPEPPGRPPDLVPRAISSRLHELGRFTLLSSFLL